VVSIGLLPQVALLTDSRLARVMVISNVALDLVVPDLVGIVEVQAAIVQLIGAAIAATPSPLMHDETMARLLALFGDRQLAPAAAVSDAPINVEVELLISGTLFDTEAPLPAGAHSVAGGSARGEVCGAVFIPRVGVAAGLPLSDAPLANSRPAPVAGVSDAARELRPPRPAEVQHGARATRAPRPTKPARAPDGPRDARHNEGSAPEETRGRRRVGPARRRRGAGAGNAAPALAALLVSLVGARLPALNPVALLDVVVLDLAVVLNVAAPDSAALDPVALLDAVAPDPVAVLSVEALAPDALFNVAALVALLVSLVDAREINVAVRFFPAAGPGAQSNVAAIDSPAPFNVAAPDSSTLLNVVALDSDALGPSRCSASRRSTSSLPSTSRRSTPSRCAALNCAALASVALSPALVSAAAPESIALPSVEVPAPNGLLKDAALAALSLSLADARPMALDPVALLNVAALAS
ncbi:unnamed protein product, partial [Prorocentrum cordatum]